MVFCPTYRKFYFLMSFHFGFEISHHVRFTPSQQGWKYHLLWSWYIKPDENPTSRSKVNRIWIKKVPWQKFDFPSWVQIDLILNQRCPTSIFLHQSMPNIFMNIILKPYSCNTTSISITIENIIGPRFPGRPLPFDLLAIVGEIHKFNALLR